MKDFLNRWMPPDHSAHGWEVDRLIVIMHWVMFFLLLFWAVYYMYVLYRFRASNHPKAVYRGMQSHWSTWSEAGVAVVEVLILAGLSIPAWKRWASPPTAADKNPVEVRIVAEQFAWNVHYPGPDGKFGKSNIKLVDSMNPLGLDPDDPDGKDDLATLNELHLIVNRPALIHIASKDVIHSFKLPVMRAEQDAIPGQDIPIHFTPIHTSKGERWEIACAQLCGLGHYRMRGLLVVDTPQDFDAWFKSQAPEAEEPAPEPNPVPAAAPAQPATTTHGS